MYRDTSFLTIDSHRSCASERTFSALRRIKTFLRSSMTQERLNHLLVLHCHNTRLRPEAIDICQVAAAFIGANDVANTLEHCNLRLVIL